jgi:hypothetical protein
MRATTGSLLVALASVCAGCNLDRTGARRRRSMAHLAQRVKPGGPQLSPQIEQAGRAMGPRVGK